MCGVHIVSLVELALQPWQSDQDGQVLPDVALSQFDSVPHRVAGSELRARYLAALDPQHARAFHAIEVLGEGPAIGAQKMALDKQHHQRVDFIEGVEHGQQVSGVAMRRDGEQVAE